MPRSERVKLRHQTEGIKADPREWVEAAGKHNPDGTLLSLVIESRAWNVCRENTDVCTVLWRLLAHGEGFSLCSGRISGTRWHTPLGSSGSLWLRTESWIRSCTTYLSCTSSTGTSWGSWRSDCLIGDYQWRSTAPLMLLRFVCGVLKTPRDHSLTLVCFSHAFINDRIGFEGTGVPFRFAVWFGTEGHPEGMSAHALSNHTFLFKT